MSTFLGTSEFQINIGVNDQSLNSSSTPEFGAVQAPVLDTPVPQTLVIGATQATTVQIASTSVKTEILGELDTFKGINISNGTGSTLITQNGILSNTLKLPINEGTNGYVLQTDGTGNTSWIAQSGGGGGSSYELKDSNDNTQFNVDDAGENGTLDAGVLRSTNGLYVLPAGTLPTSVPTSGAGTRMFFNQLKGAFRSGTVDGTQWDDSNVGTGSVAFNNNNIASGADSVAGGFGCTASNARCVAFGSSCVASGSQSMAIGHTNTASQDRSYVFGNANTVLSSQSMALGTSNTLNSGAFNSVAVGKGNVLNSSVNYCLGEINNLSGQYAYVVGRGCTMTGINTRHAIGSGNQVSASGAMAIGAGGIANGPNSYAMGNGSNTNGQTGTMVFGQNGHARSGNNYSFQLSGSNVATSSGAGNDGIGLILRTTVFGVNPTAGGVANTWTTGGADYAELFEWADGNPSTEDRIGRMVKFATASEKIEYCGIGDDDDCIGIVSGSPGVIGDSAELAWTGANQKDKFLRNITEKKYLNDVKQKLYATVGEERYNELESSVNAVTDDADCMTNVVALMTTETQEEKDDILAVEGSDSNIASNEYDPEVEYIPRSKRKEWDAIGMLGKLIVLDDGVAVVGDKVSCDADGKAKKDASGKYRVMRRVDTDTILILVK